MILNGLYPIDIQLFSEDTAGGIGDGVDDIAGNTGAIKDSMTFPYLRRQAHDKES